MYISQTAHDHSLVYNDTMFMVLFLLKCSKWSDALDFLNFRHQCFICRTLTVCVYKGYFLSTSVNIFVIFIAYLKLYSML